MGSFQILFTTPSIPVILERLMETEEGSREEALLESLSDRAYLTKAIDLLVENGLIERDNGIVRLVRNKRGAQKAQKIVTFYRTVGKVRKRDLIFRGILNSTQYKCLIHVGTFFDMMEQEGFSRPEVEALIDAETRQGWIEHLKIMYRSSRDTRHKLFPFIPLYYYPHFIVMTSDHSGNFKVKLENGGISLIEEEYLLGNYPKEIALQAREYILKEKEYIKERIKNEAFDIWWYYRF